MLRLIASFLLVVGFTLPMPGCSEKSTNPDDPASAFAAARQPFDDRLYDIAIQKLSGFKARYPYSEFASQAELLIADSHFNLRQYQEAAMSYQQFIRLYPRHEKVDYAMFKVGESYWIEAPEEIDREQEYTIQAISEWQKLLARFPNSKFSEEARKFIDLGRRRVAESYAFVIDFYCKQELWHSCAYKAIEFLDQYSEFSKLRLKALRKASQAFLQLALLKEQNPSADSNIFFQTMSAEQLKEKSQSFSRIASEQK